MIDRNKELVHVCRSAPPKKDDGGNWVIQRKTMSSRFSRAIKKIAQWCRCNRHLPIKDQHRILSQKLRGHYAYYGITGNGRMLRRLRDPVERVWRRWLSRRKRGSSLSWNWFTVLLQRYPLPLPRLVHSVYITQ
ncbi:MAG: group II intron maturase-specific domain-containing protein [Gemmataceae bacterium]